MIIQFPRDVLLQSLHVYLNKDIKLGLTYPERMKAHAGHWADTLTHEPFVVFDRTQIITR